MKRVRAGVLSAGSWSEGSHLPELAGRSDVELVVVTRPDVVQAKRVASKFGAERFETDWHRALEMELDVVVVSSPPAAHEEQVVAALEAGAHVLCEKPFALTAASAWKMVDTAKRVNRQLLVGLGWVATPVFQQAHDEIKGGELGALEHVMMHLAVDTRALLGGSTAGTWPGATESELATYSDPAVSGGGAAAVSMSHQFGMLLWLLGRPVETIHAQTFPRAERLDLHVASVVTFPGEASGSVSCASTHPYSARPQWYFAAYGSSGQIWLDSMSDELRLVRADGSCVENERSGGEGAYRASAPTAALVEAALGREPCDGYSGELSARVVEITEALYASARRGEPVTVERREW